MPDFRDFRMFPLGKRAPLLDRPALLLQNFLKVTPDHPIEVDDSPVNLTFLMDGNDTYGDCVVAGYDHTKQIMQQLLTGTNSPMTFNEIIADYKTQNPRFPNQDDGMVIQTYLEYLVKQGRILGFAHINTQNVEELRAAVYLDLAIMIGVELQMAQQDQQVWDYVAGSKDWGGHCVSWSGYQPAVFTCVTWGTELDMTLEFIQECCDEAWFIITEDHIKHPAFREGFNLTKFSAAYTVLTGRPFPVTVPPEPTPDPNPTPVPDPDFEALVQFATSIRSWRNKRHPMFGASGAQDLVNAYLRKVWDWRTH